MSDDQSEESQGAAHSAGVRGPGSAPESSHAETLLRALALVGALVALLTLPLPGVVAVGCFSLALILASRFALVFHATLFGAALPLLPIFGSGTLLSSALLYCSFCHFSREQRRFIAPFLFFLLLAFSWSFAELVARFDLSSISYLWRSGGHEQGIIDRMLRVQRLLHTAPPHGITVFLIALRYFALALLFAHFATNAGERRICCRALIWALIPALLLSSVQLGSLLGGFSLHTLFPNQGPFWSGTGRIAGSWSDPNAFGIVTVLLIPLFVTFWHSRATQLIAAATVALALFSGSRSLVVGLGCLVVVWFLSARRRGTTLAVGAVALVTVAGALWILSRSDLSALSASLPPSLSRFFSGTGVSVDPLFSRKVFLSLALEIVKIEPLVGVGIDRFRDYVVPLTSTLGFPTGVWGDNSNNFYLGVLSEMGILGVAALLCLVGSLRWRAVGERWCRVTVGVLLVLLMLGPHLLFDEVAVMTALVLSGAVEPRTRIATPPRVMLLLIPLLLTWRCFSLPSGAYPWEDTPHGPGFWTGRVVTGAMVCRGAPIELLLQARTPAMDRRPVEVVMQVSGGVPIQVSLRSQEPHTLTVPCPPTSSAREPVVQKFRLELSRVWQPMAHFGRDARLLGIQVIAKPSIFLPIVVERGQGVSSAGTNASPEVTS